MVFLLCMRQWLVNCALSGGSVLAEMIYQHRKCEHCSDLNHWNVQMNQQHSDIDFFVHRFPFELNKFYGQKSANPHPEKKSACSKEFFEVFVEKILPWFNFIFRSPRKGPLKISSRKKFNFNQYYSLSNICEIIELKFDQGQQILQITVLNSCPEVNVPWDEYVVNQFDIDIVKNTVELPYNNFPLVKFIDPSIGNSMEKCSFVFTIRPAQPFELGWKRICKYLHRGFSLQKIQFDPRVTHFWKLYWMGRFHLLFLPFWCGKLIEKTNPDDSDTLSFARFIEKHHGICKMIGEFVWQPPQKGIYLENLKKQVELERRRENTLLD